MKNNLPCNDIDCIRQLYRGQRGSCDRIPHTDAYYRLQRRACELEQAFRKSLSGDASLMRAYDALSDAQDALHAEDLECVYVEAFRFGGQLCA